MTRMPRNLGSSDRVRQHASVRHRRCRRDRGGDDGVSCGGRAARGRDSGGCHVSSWTPGGRCPGRGPTACSCRSCSPPVPRCDAGGTGAQRVGAARPGSPGRRARGRRTDREGSFVKSVTRMPAQGESEEDRRRRRRALIRAHHPDRGGDPAEFIRILQHLDQERPMSEIHPEMRFVRRRPWWRGVVSSIPRFRRTSRRPRRVV